MIFYFILIIYRIFTFCSLPFVFLFLYFTSKSQLYRKRILEHLSIFDLKLKYKSSIWLTASSMGEVIVAIELLTELKKHDKNIIITTNDYDSFLKLKPHLGDNVYHLFLPLDNYFIIKNFIKKTNPALFITIEREFFPEVLIQVKKYGAKLLIINGRLSNKSSKTYLKFSKIFSYLYSLYDKILVQYHTDYDNYAKFTDKRKIEIVGNLKFIRNLDSIQPLPIKIPVDKKIICFGSIRDGEEETIIRACKKILREEIEHRYIFILAPRYLRQVDNLTSTLENFNLISNLSINEEIKEDFLILDSVGNLINTYASSDVVVICGSFDKKYGGHNVLEPISLGKSTIIGKNYRNFQTLVDELAKNNAIVITKNENLSSSILDIIDDTEKSKNIVKNATKIYKKHTSARDNTLKIIKDYLC